MKRSLLIGSFLCVGMGVTAIISVVLGWSDIPTIVVLLLAYFVGIPMQFQKALPTQEAKLLADGKIVAVLGKRFWIPIGAGLAVALASALVLRNAYGLAFGSTVFLMLGFAAILTAFVSPRFERIDDPESFG